MSLHALKILLLHGVFVVSVFCCSLTDSLCTHFGSSLCLVRLIVIAMFHAHVECLSSTIYLTFLLFIIFSFQHFLLLFTFLEVSRQQPCALPLVSRVPGLQEILHSDDRIDECERVPDKNGGKHDKGIAEFRSRRVVNAPEEVMPRRSCTT